MKPKKPTFANPVMNRLSNAVGRSTVFALLYIVFLCLWKY